MKYLLKIYLLLFFLPLSIPAQNSHIYSVETRTKNLAFGLTEQVPAARPIVGLALSGGGSRGLSQIGVLRALSEAGLPIDIIVGTSMGSIVGGLYASGYSLDELDSIAVYTDWDALLASDRLTNRGELFVDQKVTEDKSVFTLRLDGFVPVLPTAINTGQKLSNYLNILTLGAPISLRENFDDLRIPFRAVCTNLVTGEPVVLKSGALSQALRASSSVSFLLSPVKIDSLILVDGGLVANIPVRMVKDEGSDFIIAVNTTSALYDESELHLPWIVADQVVSIPMKHLNTTQLIDADFTIQPLQTRKSSSDFGNISDILTEGYQNTLPLLSKLKESVDSLYASRLNYEEHYFSNIIVDTDEDSPVYPLLKKYEQKDSVSHREILFDLNRMFDSGLYDSLYVEITEHEDSTTLNYVFIPKPVIRKIETKGITLINEAQKFSVFNSMILKPFIAADVEEMLLKILRLYNADGYSLAEITDVRFNRTTGTLTIGIDEGNILSVAVEGNESTNTSVILREIPIKAGSFFSIKNIETALTNLRGTNLFEDVVLSVRQKKDGNELVVNVREKISSLLRAGFRVDDEKKAQFSFDIRDENLFGSGTEAGFIFYGSTRTRGYILEHRSNRVFDTYLTYRINAFYRFNDVFAYTEAPTSSDRRFSRIQLGDYRQIYYGASVAVGTQVERFGNLIVEGAYQFDELKNKISTPVSPSKLKIVSLKISSTVDTQNKYPYPTSGIYFSGFYETAQTVLGGDVGYTNIGVEYKNYLTFLSDHTISPRITMGFGDKTLPLSRQYSLGGQEMFFGMREDEFRGRQLFLTSLQYRVKLPFTVFFDTYFKLRYDLGNAWEIQDQIRFKDLRHGVGATLSFDTPIGPANFSVGRSFLFKGNLPGNPISSGDILFYFSIGY